MTPMMQVWTAAAAIVLAGMSMPAEAPPSPYQPLAFLVGHCWKGTFPDGKATDEHCFSWIYGGKFVRDEHVVHGEGHPDGFGESIYVWDPASRQLEDLVIESAGAVSPAAPSPGRATRWCSRPAATWKRGRRRPTAAAGSLQVRMPTTW